MEDSSAPKARIPDSMTIEAGTTAPGSIEDYPVAAGRAGCESEAPDARRSDQPALPFGGAAISDGKTADAHSQSAAAPLVPEDLDLVRSAEPLPPNRVFARLYEDEERVETRARWSIADTQRCCSACGELFASRSSFHTALIALADSEAAAQASPQGAPCAELFERSDFCPRCFAAVPLDTVFAHWRSVLPAPDSPPKKIVNLTALFVYFERLAAQTAPVSLAPPSHETAADGVHAGSILLGSGLSISRELLRYLLALFLVRRRVLRWRKLAGGELHLVTREEPPRSFLVSVPSLGPEEIQAAMAAFDEMFA